MILLRDTPTCSRLGSSYTDESFMVAFCSNAVGLRRCAGSKRDEDESVPCDCILDAKHPASAIIGSTSSILIGLESPIKAEANRWDISLTLSAWPVPRSLHLSSRQDL